MATLAQYLAATGETQKAFGKRACLPQATVSRLARGDRWPTRDQVRKIFLATGGAVTANDFAGQGVTVSLVTPARSIEVAA